MGTVQRSGAMVRRYAGRAALLLLILGGITAVASRGAGMILKNKIERSVGDGFSAADIGLHWASVRARGVALSLPGGREFFTADEILVRPDLLSLVTGKTAISRLSLARPRLFLEIGRNGKLLVPDIRRQPGGGHEKGEDRSVLIRNGEIRHGEIDYVDRTKAGGGILLRLREVQAGITNLLMPAGEGEAHYHLDAKIPGKDGDGTVMVRGLVNLRSADAATRFECRDMDLRLLRPYYHRPGDTEVRAGKLSVDADIRVKHSVISARGKVFIRDLAFEREGGTFLGFPQDAVRALVLEKGKAVELEFTIEGDLRNPTFDFRKSLLTKVTLSLARMLGAPIEDMGKSIFDLGGDALRKIFR